MELTDILAEIGRLKEEETQLENKAHQIRVENARYSAECSHQIDLLRRKADGEKKRYDQEAARTEFERQQAQTQKESYFDQLLALYSNGHSLEVKELISEVGDQELTRKLELLECRYSLNELLKKKSSHAKISWAGGFTGIRTVNKALDALVEGSRNSTTFSVKRDAPGIPEITLYGEKVYLVSSILPEGSFRYGFQEKKEGLPQEYSQEIFRHDMFSHFYSETIGGLHLFSAPPVKNDHLEWLGLLIKQAVAYQEKAESIGENSVHSTSHCDG